MIIHSNDYSTDFLQRITLIEEELLIEEENYLKESLSELLNEGFLTRKVSRNLENFFTSFITAIRGVFNRFVENITYLFKTSEKWLEDNRDNIFNADLKNFKQRIFPYWEASGVNQAIDSRLRTIDQNLIDQVIKLNNNEDEFRRYCLKMLGINNVRAEKEYFTEDLKIVLRGSQSKIIQGSAVRAQVKGMFDYCMEYKNEHKKVIGLKNKIENGCNKAIQELRNERNKYAEEPNNQKENKITNESIELLFEDSFLFSNILNENITGAAEKIKGPTNPTELSKENKKMEEKNQESNNNEEPRIKENKRTESASNLINAFTTCLNVYQSFFTTRITIMEERFKQNMKVLRQISKMSMMQSTNRQERGQTANNYEQKPNALKTLNKLKGGGNNNSRNNANSSTNYSDENNIEEPAKAKKGFSLSKARQYQKAFKDGQKIYKNAKKISKSVKRIRTKLKD